MVIITHKLPDVMRFIDEVTVLRRRRLAGHGATTGLSRGDLTSMMIGEPHAPARPERRGGQRPGGGAVTVGGVPYAATRRQSQALHVRVIPEEPLRNGCVPGMSVVDNLNMRQFDQNEGGSNRRWLDASGMRRRAARMIAGYGVRAVSADVPVGVLSGGNVQRCVLPRELDGEVALLIVANPCFGLDVKAVAEVRARLMAARNAGCAILLISEDLDEILEIADRVVVMRNGRIVHEASAAGADPHAIGAHVLAAAAVIPAATLAPSALGRR